MMPPAMASFGSDPDDYKQNAKKKVEHCAGMIC